MNGESTLGVAPIPVRYSRMLLIRGAVIWALARVGVLALYTFIASSARRSPELAEAFTYGSPLVLSGWTLALSAVLLRFDLHRRHEVTLLNNLGVRASHAVVLGALPAVVMETVLAILR